ncbi:MAG: hypothetical protein ABI821_07785 [Pseudomonadota bacterium]
MGIDNNIDWTAATTPQSEQYGPGLSRKSRFQSLANQAAENKAAAVTLSRHDVMDKLLGDNDLAAHDAGGNDPYNATGRQFRR